METISTTVARTCLGEIVNKVKYQRKIIALGRNKKPEVYIVPIPDAVDLPITQINADSSAFDFLYEEPDLYSVSDIKERYV